MGKRGAYSGESAKDRSMKTIESFISKNSKKYQEEHRLPGRRKDPSIPIDLWPLKDQLEYWDNLTESEKFDSKYPVYSVWYDEVKSKSGLYHQTFTDFTTKFKPEMKQMWLDKMSTRDALNELRKRGVY